MKQKDLLEKNEIIMWSEEKIRDFRATLLQWYDENKRDLPWRSTSDPYYIWVSEIMLQQTQVDTVIPYYKRFIETLPTIEDLAKASEETLLKLWEGLGYYSRVRNMNVAANQILEKHEGKFPTAHKDVLNLKGIGPYTAGAVTSIAFNQPQPAVDGNVMRVLSRLFEIDLDISKASTRKVFEEMIRRLIDPDRPGDFNQALMDLGATICTPKNYSPENSPVKEFNASYLNESWEKYPVKKKKNKVTEQTYYTVMVKNKEGEYLYKKRPSKGVLAGMHTPLMIDRKDLNEEGWKAFNQKELYDSRLSQELEQIIKETYDLKVTVNEQPKGVVAHVFSHLKWEMIVFEAVLIEELSHSSELKWIHADRFDEEMFPMPTQKVNKLVNTLTLF
ncbi:A/G-specific DNA-adenine glycosylase [Alkalibacterium putridalgicola]|uniref:Adenine DNA glycosylase n=2 Tax=Alkalibacterium putridalgicola TaxID=426703 RepID=A0A1H7W607_9LACT|nr:A/G-specific adenine glycosylase [Alkalibacterium putridalgicola]GEK89966.1 A/G-specific adenine glycosylase [Alkalibacterium putridalgicola]SEM16946.1 A/G-specific DNA-adenine glycosylase [Alkalibacterium putridalgicola]